MWTYAICHSLEKFRLSLEQGEKNVPRDSASSSFPPSPGFPLVFWIFCRSGHVSIIESLASAATDEFQLVAGWPVSRGPRMGFPGFCTSSFHGTTRSFAFRPYLLHLLLLFHLSLVHLASLPSPPSLSSASLDTAESLSIPICLSFHLTEPQTWEPSVGDWMAGLAGRQSQLRSWLKVGARTKYAPVSSGSKYKPRSFFHWSEDSDVNRNSFPCICEFLRNCFEGCVVLYPVRSIAVLKREGSPRIVWYDVIKFFFKRKAVSNAMD